MEHHRTSWIITELWIENLMQIDHDWPLTSFLSPFLSFSLFYSPFLSFSLFFVIFFSPFLFLFFSLFFSLSSICIQFPEEKLNILAEMLEISKSGLCWIYSRPLSLMELLSELKMHCCNKPACGNRVLNNFLNVKIICMYFLHSWFIRLVLCKCTFRIWRYLTHTFNLSCTSNFV